MSLADGCQEDFLDVDKQIPGQNYVCISFVSPEKMIMDKQEYYFHHYYQNKLKNYDTYINNKIVEIVDKCLDNSVDISQVVKLKKDIAKMFKEDKLEVKEFKSKYEDFKFKEHKELDNKYDNEHDFKTSVRGVKVRGVYESYKQAEIRAKVLQRMDQTFDVFVGQMGYWLPWDPDSNKIENQEYLNNDLNELVRGYKENEAKKDIFFEEEKMGRKKEAQGVAERLRKKLELKRQQEQEEQNRASKQELRAKENTASIKNELSNENELLSGVTTSESTSNKSEQKIEELPDDDTEQLKPVEQTKEEIEQEEILSDTAQSLNSTDPWMQRKLEEN